jgi:PBP1b-binding outer membrane lipoprotein LpoB
MKTAIAILMIAILVAGCMQGAQTQEKTTTTSEGRQTTIPVVEATSTVSVDDVPVPFIEENETVEIGEMI